MTEWLTDSGLKRAPWKNRALQREAHKEEWELYVFQALQTFNSEDISDYLALLFCSTRETRVSLDNPRKDIHQYEETLIVSDHVKEDEVRRRVNGLLRSDLLNERKRAALTDISNHREPLTELADVLSMRLSSID